MRALPGDLRVFITPGCWACRRALELAEWLRKTDPRLRVQVVDLSEEPDAGGNLVFAVPTYVYGGKAIFLGNPSLRELEIWLDSLRREE